MIRVTLAVLMVAMMVSGASGQDAKTKARIIELEKQIAEAEKKIATAKAELAKLKPKPKEKMPLDLLSANVGDVGVLYQGTFRSLATVVSIIDDDHLIMRFNDQVDTTVVIKMPTKGIADGKIYNISPELPGDYKITGTKKLGTKTLYVLEKQ